MKTNLLALSAFGLFFAANARANDVTCMDDHTDQAAHLMAQAMQKSIETMLAKKGIEIDSSKSTFDLTAATVDETSDGVYGYFQIEDDTLVTKDGTELTVELKQDLFGQDDDGQTAYFKPILKSAGFDREGNARNPHCTLVSDDLRADDKADHLLITNSHTGHVVGRALLPPKVILY